MNKEELVIKLTEYVEATEDFITYQAPLVVQEILIRPWIAFGLTLILWIVLVLVPLFDFR